MKLFSLLFIPLGCLCLLISIQTYAEAVKMVKGPSYPVKLSKAKRPNVIIFFCDNLGYGDVEPFGSKVNRTPNLNRMVKEGRKFTSFYVTAGVCTPSRASIMTGCYSQRVGMHLNPRDGNVIRPISPYGLNPGEITVAEVLKDQGYKTGIIGKWHLGDQTTFLPLAQGFDYFFGIPYSDDMTQDVGRRLGDRYNGNQWPALPLMLNNKVIEAGVDRNLLTKRYTEKALEFISQNQESPFFLYLPQAMPGSTKTPFSSEAFRGKSKGGLWGDSVEELDWSIGQIMNELVNLGIEQNTLLIFTSDNGAPMTEDSSSIEIGTNKPLFGRGYTTAEGAFRVPAIMWWPGTIPAGTVCTEFMTTMDILPTLASLSGAKTPKDRIIDGYNNRSLILGKKGAKSPYKVFYYYNADQLQAVKSGPWKLFLPLTDFVQHPHFRKGEETKPLLFNLEKDISSANNLAEKYPEIVSRLMALAERGRQDLGDTNRPGANQRPPGKIQDPVAVTLQ